MRGAEGVGTNTHQVTAGTHAGNCIVLDPRQPMTIIDEICAALGEYYRVNGKRPSGITVHPETRRAMMRDIRGLRLFEIERGEQGETFEGLPITTREAVKTYQFI